MKLKLKEIIWEVTNLCSKQCTFCGSKDIIIHSQTPEEAKLEEDKIRKIAKEIAKYPPEEITLSGGETGCLNPAVLSEVIETLNAAKIKVKVVTNGHLLEGAPFEDFNFLKKFNAIGISINTETDVKYIKNLLKNVHKSIFGGLQSLPITIITNFGRHNIWDFEKIKNFIDETFETKCWQVQLTMDKENEEFDELQLNEDGIKFLWEKLATVPFAIMADNLKPKFECMAGLASCGILYDGTVIPCLSQRCWKSPLFPSPRTEYIFNILSTPLREIWMDGFKEERFACSKCCRDNIKYPDTTFKELETLLEKDEKGRNIAKITIVYGVTTPNDWNPYWPGIKSPSIQMYGVAEPSTFIYGVFNPNDNSSAKNSWDMQTYTTSTGSTKPTGDKI